MAPGEAAGRKDNVLIVHWHDLGRYLGVYGHPDVSSPRLDRLAAEGILFTRAHATAPLCSPSRGSLFTGRYPQSNGLIGLAHHGWEYRSGVRTLPQILTDAGWYSALFGMQHETSYPQRLGFDEFDVSNSYCEYVVDKAGEWLREGTEDLAGQPFLLTAGFFETHRPYPRDRYEPADSAEVDPPDYLPDTPEVRGDLADFYGSISDGRRRRRPAAGHAGRNRPGRQHLGGVLHRSRPGVPPREIHAVRRGNRHRHDHPAPHRPGARTPASTTNCSAASTCCRRCWGCWVSTCRPMSKGCRTRTRCSRRTRTPCRSETTCTPRRPITTRSIPSARFAPRNTATSRITCPGRCSTCRWTSRRARPGTGRRAVRHGPRPERELYDLRTDPTETTNLLAGGDAGVDEIAADLAVRLHDWRQRTGDVIPSEFAGTRIAARYTETYLQIHRLKPTSRSAIAADRGIEEQASS